MESFSSIGRDSTLKNPAFVSRTILGLSGVASSGKDTFFSLLSQKLPFQRFALADELKILLRPKLLNCSREEKNAVRDELVHFAKQKRLDSNGKFWTDILTKKILESDHQYICITDIRYNFFVNDEVFWLKNMLGGYLVDVSSYNPNTGEVTQTPNEEESFHYPKVKKAADYFVVWPIVNEIKKLDFYVDQCIFDLNLK